MPACNPNALGDKRVSYPQFGESFQSRGMDADSPRVRLRAFATFEYLYAHSELRQPTGQKETDSAATDDENVVHGSHALEPPGEEKPVAEGMLDVPAVRHSGTKLVWCVGAADRSEAVWGDERAPVEGCSE